MKPRHRNRRLAIFCLWAFAAIGGVWLIVSALKDNTQFFHSPSAVVTPGFTPKSTQFRVGGLVKEGTWEKGEDLLSEFEIIDFKDADTGIAGLRVSYTGVLPDLFREGEGVVLTGALSPRGVFVASEVLAKHDNEYMPALPENGQ